MMKKTPTTKNAFLRKSMPDLKTRSIIHCNEIYTKNANDCRDSKSSLSLTQNRVILACPESILAILDALTVFAYQNDGLGSSEGIPESYIIFV